MYPVSDFLKYLNRFVGRPYWYGTCVYSCTKDLYNRKKTQYPSHYTSSRDAGYKKAVDMKEVCADCVGMLKGYAWTDGGKTVFESIGTGSKIESHYGKNGAPDQSADGMFDYAKSKGMEWGTIASMPDIAGLAVRMAGHVGVYIGNGEVVEERGFNYGCVVTKLADRKWTHWYKLPWILYDDAPIPEHPDDAFALGERLLVKGCIGDDVHELQTLLMSFGYSLPKYGADGEYGSETVSAVKNFQQSVSGLTVDGEYGQKSHAALMSIIAEKDAQAKADEDIEINDVPVPMFATQFKLVATDEVHARKAPDTSYDVLAVIPVDTSIDSIAKAVNGSGTVWYAVVMDGYTAWVSEKYVRVEE